MSTRAGGIAGVVALLLVVLVVSRCAWQDLENDRSTVERRNGGQPRLQLAAETVAEAAREPVARDPVEVPQRSAEMEGMRWLTIRLVEEGGQGNPVPGFSVSLTATCDGRSVLASDQTTDHSGEIRLQVPFGAGVVTGRGRSDLGQVTLFRSEIATEQEVVEWVMPPIGWIVGSVVERGSRRAIPGASVGFVGDDDVVVTDANGSFVLWGLVGQHVDLQVARPGMGVEYCQSQPKDWQVDRRTIEVRIEMSAAIKVEGRIVNLAGRGPWAVRWKPAGRVGRAPGASIGTEVQQDGLFCWSEAPRGMAFWLEFVVDGRVMGCASWLGSEVDTQLGEFRLPDSCHVTLRRGAGVGLSDKCIVNAESRMSLGDERGDKRLRPGNLRQMVEWAAGSAELRLQLPVGPCAVRGFAGGRKVLPVEFVAADGMAVEVAAEGTPWRFEVMVTGAGSAVGTVLVMDANRRPLGESRVDRRGVATFAGLDPGTCAILCWSIAPARGWRKEVEMEANSSQGEQRLTIAPDVRVVAGTVASERPGRISVQVSGRSGSRLARYRHDDLQANVPWQVRVEEGADYEITWTHRDAVEGGRSLLGGSAKLGVVTGDRTVVIR